MDIDDFVDQFLKLREREIEQKVWELWLAKLPPMIGEDYMSYSEMLNLVKGYENDEIQSSDEIYIDQCFF